MFITYTTYYMVSSGTCAGIVQYFIEIHFVWRAGKDSDVIKKKAVGLVNNIIKPVLDGIVTNVCLSVGIGVCSRLAKISIDLATM